MDNSLIFMKGELDKDISFEVTKDVKVTTHVTYKKEEIIENLVNRIKHLESQINQLGKSDSHSIVSESLMDVWDNESDDRWNEC